MNDIRNRLLATRNSLLALTAAATLAACQSPTVSEVHRVALDSMPPAYATLNERQLGAWRLADAAHRVQMRVRARNAQADEGVVSRRELHVETLAARALHPIAAIGPVTPQSSGERSLVAAR